LKQALLALLNGLRSAGRHASRSEIAEVFDTHFGDLVAAADPHAGAVMSPTAKERGHAALIGARANQHEGADSARGGRLPNWLLVAAALAMIGAVSAIWFLNWNNDADRIAIPTPPPKAASPDKPQPSGPDLERQESPLVEDHTDEPGATSSYMAPKKPRSTNRERTVADAQQAVGVLVSGVVRVREPDANNWIDLAANDKVYSGSKIQTGDGETAELKLENGSILKLSFGTLMAINTDSNFDLEAGSIFAEIAEMSADRPFIIATGDASARALGTAFGLSIEKLGSKKTRTVLQVREGRVEFFNELDSVVVKEMSMSTAVRGSAPTEPRRINTLRIYGFSGTGQMLERRTFPLDEEEAAGYYVYPLGTIGLMAGTVPNGELRILTLEADASARQAGLRVGDAILSIDGRRPGMDSFRRGMYFRAGEIVSLQMKRNGQIFEASVPVALARDLPSLTPELANSLEFATRPALEGKTELSLERLQHLAQIVAHPAVFNNLGVVYERLDRMGSAARHYQKAIEMDPRSSLYRRALARVLLNVGNDRKSIEELEFATELNSGEIENVLALADAYQVAGRMVDALQLMAKSENQFEKSAEFWIAKAAVLMRANQLPAAIVAAQEASRVAPDNAAAQFRLGLALTFSDKFEEAEIAFAKAIELDPCLATYYNSRAINLTHLNRNEEAEAEYRKAVTLDPEFVPARIGLGGLLVGLGKIEEAEKLLRGTIEIDPGHPDAYYNLGVLLKGQGRYVEAEQMFRKTTTLGFVHVDYHWQHAHTLGLLGRFDESLAAYKRALSVAPEYPYLLNAFGWAQIEVHRWLDAVETLRRAIELDPNGVAGNYARMNLGFALIHVGKLDEAESVLAVALKNAPDDFEAASRWALLLAHKGMELDKALRLATKEPIPEAHGHLHYTLGYVYFRRKEYDKAETSLMKAIKDYGRVFLAADAWVVLGQVREAQGNLNGAIAAYKRALLIEPSNRPAAEALKRLGG
jgi:tetratricopeptide (TPR) repeat protein